jgi:glycosyltransferase involved in cell wall biosynthesis
MNIAVNARLIMPSRLEGNGTAIYQLMRRLPALLREHHFFLLFDRPPEQGLAGSFPGNVTLLTVGPPAQHPLLMYWYYEHSLARAFREIKPDLYFSGDGFMSLRAKLPTLLIVPDLCFLEDSSFLRLGYRWYYRHYFPRFVKASARLLALTEFGKNDIARRLGYPLERIDVAPNGPSWPGCHVSKAEKEGARARFSRGAPYFLFIGPVHPRKNLQTLLLAFDRFKHQDGGGHKLLVAGSTRHMDGKTRRTLRSLAFRSAVIFTGWVEPETLAQLLAAARGLCYPSLYEGFGLPVLDAMSLGVPVVASATTSIPEVAGRAAILVDPLQPAAMAEAMRSLVLEPDRAREMVRQGYIQAGKFSWDEAARIVCRSLRRVLEGA